MKIKHVGIEWHEGYANAASFVITIDGRWDESSIRYEERDNCYFGHHAGIVRFYYYSKPGDGYGGRSFVLNMIDGTQATLKGPWSSRASVMNKLGFEPSVEARIIDDKYDCIGGAVTIAALTSFLDEHPELNIKVVEVTNNDGEVSYYPAEVQADGTLKIKLWPEETNYKVLGGE